MKRLYSTLLACSLLLSPLHVLALNTQDAGDMTEIENQMDEMLQKKEETQEMQQQEYLQDENQTENSTPLTMPSGSESFPSFSYDGSNSFTGNFDFSGMNDQQLATVAFSQDFISQYSNEVMNGSTMSFSEMFSQMTGRDVSQEAMFDISKFGTGSDVGEINLQYSLLTDSLMKEKASGDLSGKSINATKVFTDNYGNLAKKMKIKKAKIPKKFNPNKMLASQISSVDKTYSKYMKNDPIFQQTNGQISINGIFDKAQNGVTTYDLDSANTLKKNVSNESKDIKNGMKGEYDENAKKVDASLKISQFFTTITKNRKKNNFKEDVEKNKNKGKSPKKKNKNTGSSSTGSAGTSTYSSGTPTLIQNGYNPSNANNNSNALQGLGSSIGSFIP